jgi:hypothetical protein
MDALMIDLSGNAKLRPIIDDGEADVALWNKAIAKYFLGPFAMRAILDFPLLMSSAQARIL